MMKLEIPASLQQEFFTVHALWQLTAPTRGVDMLLLSWIKYEKQLRRLFCYLIFQHPNIKEAVLTEAIAVLVSNRLLTPETFTRGIAALGVPAVPDLVGPRYAVLEPQMLRIKRYRNKIAHGQVSGQGITSRQLERDVLWILDWMECLAVGASAAVGYDGIGRNTFRRAKASPKIVVNAYPFSTPAELKTWLGVVTTRQ